ncbi:hypothetical protein Q5V44_001807, partial [Campylobacter jejuni]|nr:hypothetical protein [Campylobacter jejuni]
MIKISLTLLFYISLHIKNEEIPKTKKAYDILRAKNDLLVKELYGLSDDEFSYMISTFK